jgi:Fungal N-terminal domain of STAND proteins
MAFMGTSVIDLLSVVQILQETYSGVKNLPREISDLSIEVTALREVLFALSRLPIHDGMKDLDRNSGFHNLVVSCGRTLTDIQQEVGQVFGIDKTKQIFRNGLIFYRMLKHADRIRDLKHDLDRHKATFSVLLSGFSM